MAGDSPHESFKPRPIRSQALWYFPWDEASSVHRSVNFESIRRNAQSSETLMVIPRPGSELKAVEEACREASRTAEALNGLNGPNKSI
jgi:hypothetical protein